MSFRGPNKSDLEAIAAIGSGAALEPIAGLSGLINLVNTGSPMASANIVEKIQSMGYQPNDPKSLEQIGKFLQYPMELYEKGTNYLGDKTLEHTDSPALAAIAKASPEIAGGIFGIRQMLKNSGVPTSAPNKSDNPDNPSRRKFLKNVGIGTAGVAAGPSILKGLMDVPAAPLAAKTVAAKAAVPTVSPKIYSFIQSARALTDAYKSKSVDAKYSAGSNGPTLNDAEFKIAKEHIKSGEKVHIDVDQLKYPRKDVSVAAAKPGQMPDELNPFDELADIPGGSDLNILDAQMLEGIANGAIDPNNFKKDILRYIDDYKLNNHYEGPLDQDYVDILHNTVLKSDDPVGDLFKRNMQTEFEMFGEISDPADWLYK